MKTVSSLQVSKVSGKKHCNILSVFRKIFPDHAEDDYNDTQLRVQPIIYLTPDEFMEFIEKYGYISRNYGFHRYKAKLLLLLN